MSNKDTYKRKHAYLDKQINTLEKHNSYNRTVISNLKKKKLKLKDNMVATVNEQMDLFIENEKERKYKQLQSMIHTQKRRDKKKRAERKKRIQYAIRRTDVLSGG